MSIQPGYIEHHKSGELDKRISILQEILKDCVLCARNCHINRNNQLGWCKTGRLARISSYSAHFGEEKPLVGMMGSGTIFFTNCNLGCIFCQNYTISHLGEGTEINKFELANIMLKLQEMGCHNINFVSPSHVVTQIVESLPIAIEGGLNVPLVYNTGGYDNPDTIKLLDGIIDIYMPDIKYGDNDIGYELSCAKDYWDISKKCLKIMHKQVGDLVIEDDIAKKGLMVRHLVLPNKLSTSEAIFEFLAEEVSTNTYLNIMDQYYPSYKADSIGNINRKVSMREYKETIALAKSLGLFRLD
ncbi:MAG: radical SAM protein [Cyanobacteriota bacterium]